VCYRSRKDLTTCSLRHMGFYLEAFSEWYRMSLALDAGSI
jgi:hypothetical protein